MNNNYNHLGARSYYIAENTVIKNHDVFNNKQIDEVAVLGVLMKSYPLSNRTLVKGVNRTPWMSRLSENNQWLSDELPRHNSIYLSSELIANEMKVRLMQEASNFLKNKKKIGVLLSGGMDSRVVAGILKQLQENNEYKGDVVALTWGLENSRDVIYSKLIAKRFGWDFRYFPLSVDVLKQNIYFAAERGAEYSPIHLHGMYSVSKENDLDGILAGSYGDSIGRGEYSGITIENLPHILKKNLNNFGFLLNSANNRAIKQIKLDLKSDRDRFPNRKEMEYREIEMQMHYMRRQLNACMEIIDDNVPVYQMFGSKDVFGFMWSLNPACRNDDNYEYLLKKLPGNLLDIPWARTGSTYNQNHSNYKDDYLSLNNKYGKWLRIDLRDLILSEINSGRIQSLGIFNENAIDMWSNKWPKNDNPKANRLDEKMAWLASLSMFIQKYNIRGLNYKTNHTFFDYLSVIKALIHTKAYHLAIRALKK